MKGPCFCLSSVIRTGSVAGCGSKNDTAADNGTNNDAAVTDNNGSNAEAEVTETPKPRKTLLISSQRVLKRMLTVLRPKSMCMSFPLPPRMKPSATG
jgi:hypothetical protein